MWRWPATLTIATPSGEERPSVAEYVQAGWNGVCGGLQLPVALRIQNIDALSKDSGGWALLRLRREIATCGVGSPRS